MVRRSKFILGACAAHAVVAPQTTARALPYQYDVVVIGGSAAGVAAAIAAKRMGARVLLTEETTRFGGTLTSGVAAGDMTRPGTASGLFREYGERAYQKYWLSYGYDLPVTRRRCAVPTASDPCYALNIEPAVGKQVIDDLLNDARTDSAYSPSGSLETLLNTEFVSATRVVTSDGRVHIEDVTINDGTGASQVTARYFIDATDMGDLLGAVGDQGVDWTIGRESRSDLNEEHAGEEFVLASDNKTVIGGSHLGDSNVMAYNYRLTLVNDGLDPTDLEALQGCSQFNSTFQSELDDHREAMRACLLNHDTSEQRSCLPGFKWDEPLNAPPEWSQSYPLGSPLARLGSRAQFRNYALCYVDYMRNHDTDPAHPFATVGLSLNDYPEEGNFPPTLYAREGRRLLKLQKAAMFTEANIWAGRQTHADTIGVGEYAADSHCVTSAVPPSGARCDGFHYLGQSSYEIPRSVITPDRIDNLLVPMAVAASHVGFGTLRIDFERMTMGQAAGTLAGLAAQTGAAIDDVDIRDLQYQLARQRVMLRAFGDMSTHDVNFFAAQTLAAAKAVSGYPLNGDFDQFLPDAFATRGQGAQMFAYGLDVPPPAPISPRVTFSDVPYGSTFYKPINALANAATPDSPSERYVSGYADGTFHPEDNLTRWQAAKIISNAMGIPRVTCANNPFSDEDPYQDPTFYVYVQNLVCVGAVVDDGAGRFNGAGGITRGDLAAMVVRARRALSRAARPYESRAGAASRSNDYDGDGKTEVAVWRDASATYFYKQSSNNVVIGVPPDRSGAHPGDVPAPGDYDGDGKTDVALFRPSDGSWRVLGSATGQWKAVRYLGANGDVPTPADYDGDGKTDIAVWRPTTGVWSVISSRTGESSTVGWGSGLTPWNDVPVPADYDGDGKADMAVFRPGTGQWWVITSSNGAGSVYATYGSGVSPYYDVPMAADYDGDGRADVSVWRRQNGDWYVAESTGGQIVRAIGQSSSTPLHGDFNGDGKTDFEVWNAAYWTTLYNDGSTQPTGYWWATPTDSPRPLQ